MTAIPGQRNRAARRILGGSAAAVLLLMTWHAAAAAQTSRPPGGFQGLSQQNRNEPIKIAANSLEVRDKDKTATFTDNVRVIQGDTLIECKVLIVHYNADTKPGGAPPPAAQAAGDGGQQIRKIEIKGGVVVTQKDQTAVGDEGVYDVPTGRMTLTGNVVLTQGQNVVRGDRLWVDVNTGVSRVESAKGGQGRVDAVLQPGTMKDTPRPGSHDGGAAPANGNGRPGNAGPARTQSSSNADRDKSKQSSPPPRPLRLN